MKDDWLNDKTSVVFNKELITKGIFDNITVSSDTSTFAELKDVQNKQNGVIEISNETTEDYMIEKVIMGLRLVNGINLNEVKKILRMDRLKMLIENNFIIHKEELIKTTFKGRLNLNTILAEIIK